LSKKRAEIPEHRQQRIAELIRGSGSVTVDELEREFGISPATARRDLAVLESQGKVRRTHGGAVMPGLAQHEDSFQQRLGEAVEAKKRLARAASPLLQAEETVFIDSSTTAYYAARRMIADAPSVTYLSNLVPVMDLFSNANSPSASMVGLGGIFRPLTLSFVGPCTVRMIESYLADRTFFSVKGITPDGLLTEPNPLEAEVKRTMIRQAETSVLLVDGRKFEQRSANVLAHVSDVSLVMTTDARQSYVEALEDLGVAVETV
jgi:DeoR family transcriptional regulator of aga operon